MKKLLSCIIALTIFAGGLFCAQQANDQTNAKIAPPAKASHVSLGLDWSHSKSKTDSDRVGGNPYGIVIGYEYIKPDFLYFYGTAEWAVGTFKGGNITYTGYSHYHSFEGHIGWNFGLGQDNEFAIIPLVGAYYTLGKDNIYTPFYYKDKERSWQLPFGVYLNWDIIPELNIGIKAIGYWDINDKTIIRSGSISASSKAKKEINWTIFLPIKYYISPEWFISFVPYYMSIKSTPKTNTSVFGTSTTKGTDIGGTIYFGYCF